MTASTAPEVEQRVRAALAARADLVTADALSRTLQLEPPHHSRRLVLVAAAAVVVGVAAVAGLLTLRGPDDTTVATDSGLTNLSGVQLEVPAGWTTDPMVVQQHGVRRYCVHEVTREGPCAGLQLFVADPPHNTVNVPSQSGLYFGCPPHSGRIWTFVGTQIDGLPGAINDFHCNEGDPPNWFWSLDNGTVALLTTDAAQRSVAEAVVASMHIGPALRAVPVPPPGPTPSAVPDNPAERRDPRLLTEIAEMRFMPGAAAPQR